MINISKLYCGLPSQSDHLRYQSSSSSGPIVVYNCTGRCNLHCLHCYISAGSKSYSDELTTAQAKKLLSQLAQANCPVVLFSGGEVLLRGDLFELLSQAKCLGLRTVISSNGTLIDSATAKNLANVDVSYVGISIDGNQEFHDQFRGAKGSFKAALAGIENCKKVGIKTGLRFTITSQNAGQVPVIFDIAASMGIKRICFYHLIAAGRAKELSAESHRLKISSRKSSTENQKHPASESYTPSPAQTRQVLDTILQKTAELVQRHIIDEVLTVGNHADGPYLLIKMKKEAKSSRRKAKNWAKARQLLLAAGGNKIGEKIVCISWNGDVHPDQFWRNYSLGNIRDRSFKQIWENSDEPVLIKLRNKSRFADASCLRCKWFDFCKGNYRFLGDKPDDEYWLNEPACYLTDEEITE